MALHCICQVKVSDLRSLLVIIIIVIITVIKQVVYGGIVSETAGARTPCMK